MTVKHHLKDEKIWMWQTDNGSEFRGDMIDGPEGLVEELVREKLQPSAGESLGSNSERNTGLPCTRRSSPLLVGMGSSPMQTRLSLARDDCPLTPAIAL